MTLKNETQAKFKSVKENVGRGLALRERSQIVGADTCGRKSAVFWVWDPKHFTNRNPQQCLLIFLWTTLKSVVYFCDV